jgi:hypothetical protein
MMNGMMTMRSLVFALLALHAAAAEACYVPPREQLIGIDEQLGQATNVAVGQVIGVTPLGGQSAEYRFLVLEQLVGPPQKVFTVVGRAATLNDKDTSFDNHRDSAFWAHGGGRTMNEGDCVIHPSFVVGNSYLVFLGATPTWRSFEKLDMFDSIVNHDDKWLAYVKAWLGRMAASQQGVPYYERVGRFIYGFHRIVTRDDLDRKGLAAQQAPAELMLRAGLLADEFDRIIENPANVPDAKLDATLHEAGAVHAALQAWRDSAGSPE